MPTGTAISPPAPAGQAAPAPGATCEPSGAAWVARFPTSTSVSDCAPPFRDQLTAFIAALDGVDIAWAHVDAQGAYDAAASVAAAQAMADAYGLRKLGVAPALASRHIDGLAVDMAIAWTGSLTIARRAGAPVTVASLPRSGMNPDLHAVGATYGVIKFVGGAADIPHWSSDGH
jgi:hypothetical protein